MAADPLFRHLEKKIAGALRGFILPQPIREDLAGIAAAQIAACADDIGLALASISLLIPLAEGYEDIAKISGLHLNIKKSIVVVLARDLSPSVLAFVLAWLAEHVPRWVGIQVKSALKYLGFWLGPEAARHVWAKPLLWTVCVSMQVWGCLILAQNILITKTGRCLETATYLTTPTY